jgi:tetratricopeptide (TPR) repeat protein
MAAAAIETFRRAVALHSAGDLPAARSAYETVLQDDPGHTDALGNLAILTLQLGDVGLSEKLARQTVARAPDHANGWNNLGLALKTKGDYAGAEAAFRKCLEFDPKHEQCWNNLGEARALIGDLEGAIPAYARALKLKPDMPAAPMAYVHRKQQIADWEGLDNAIAQMSRMIRRGDPGIEAFGLLFCCQDPAEILATARNCAREIQATAARHWNTAPFVHTTKHRDKIRIG